MLYREIIAVCSHFHTKHINTLCGQNVELLNVKLVVHIVTTGQRTVYQQLQSCDAQRIRITDHRSNVAALTAAILLTLCTDVPA